jgi:hypothetical protein
LPMASTFSDPLALPNLLTKTWASIFSI